MGMMYSILILASVLLVSALRPHLKRIGRQSGTHSHTAGATRTCMASNSGVSLAPDPLPNSIGNFFDNTTDAVSFIQCYMLNLANIEGDQYGVGFPVDMPVMLGYFEGNEFLPVEETHLDYDHLMNHVAVQMDSNDFQLYRTPVVLTLQGELEDAEEEEEDEDEYDGEEYDDEEEGEMSLEELMALEDEYDEDEYEEYEDEDEEDDNDSEGKTEEASFMNESPIGKINPKYDAQPDISIFRPKDGEDPAADLPADAFVTEADTKSLRKAHRRADRIMSYASDIKLIATFHYKKRNFHLVKLLDPIFVIGKRIHDIKGYYFSLLDDETSATVTPKLEKLLAQRNEDDKKRVAQGLPPTTAPIMDGVSQDEDGMDLDRGSGSRGMASLGKGQGDAPRARRSWRERKRAQRG